MIKKNLVLALILISTFCNAQTSGTNAVKILNTQLDSASYAFGLGIAENLKSRGISELNYAVLAKAMEDVFKGSNRKITLEQGQRVISSILSKADKAQSVANKVKYEAAISEGKKFLTENKTKSGVVTLPSGVQYSVIRKGTGPKPKISDEVTVHYKGTLLNGKQFDSSYDRNEPITLSLNKVIPGWTEGLQQMPAGSKYKFFIPYEAGYGERGAGEDIPPYSTLIFEIELLKVVTASAPSK